MRRIFLFFICLASHLNGASVLAAGPSGECNASDYVELVRCGEKSSSEMGLAEQQLKSSKKLEEIAQQWVNPEWAADSVSKGSEWSETNVSLLFTLRLGGKRQALVSEAQSEMERSQASRDLGVSQSRLELMLSLYRLRHLKGEIHLESESIDTFSKIVDQFQKRKALSPEQDVSASVFKMALADHQLKLVKLRSDEEKYFKVLTAVTGISKEAIAKCLPAPKDHWPVVDSAGENERSPQVRGAWADLKLARSRKEIAQASAWPDLKMGPTIKAVRESGVSTMLVGVAVALPFPVFNQKNAERDYSEQKVIEAEMAFDQSRRKLAAQRAELVNRYNQTSQGLNKSLSLKILNEKHEKIERQFFKGLVPSSLVIEAHRQLIELETQRNESEMEALDALGKILIIDNKFSEVFL